MDANEVGIIIASISALVVGIAGVFLKYLSAMSKQDKHERMEILKMNSDALKMLSKSLEQNTSSNKEIASATKKSADEAEKRNGHIVELVIKAEERAVEVADRNYKCIQQVTSQHINKQVIDQQVIKGKKK